MRINFDHEIDNNPQPEEAGTITVTATIFGDDDEFDTPFTTRSHSIQDFFGCDEDEDSDCQIVRELKCFLLMEAIIDDDDVIGDAMRKLVAYIDGVACFTSSSDYSLGCALSVQMDLFPEPIRPVITPGLDPLAITPGLDPLVITPGLDPLARSWSKP
uniref:Uncharacterized protein n=1 Tax=Brassica oleracea TaxID=3712 RepID=A0A3P6GUD4_BRAOL|nr:unnamed protein product [Brassica oleracea]